MKKIVCISLLLLYIVSIKAQTIMNGQVTVRDLSVTRSEGNLFVSMDVDVSALDMKSNREVVLTPVLKAEEESVRLPNILIAGRNRYYYNLRNNSALENESLYRVGKVTNISYQAVVPFAEWMTIATLTMDEDLCGCQCEVLMNNDDLLTSIDFAPKVFDPSYVYLPPKAEAVKIREVKGSAYIDFPVNRTEIYKDFRNNPAELQKIKNTIDAVKDDADTQITSVSIKGYASPEGPYANNARLASGRTETLKEYVQQLYSFPASVFTTSSEPEDWSGLRAYVEESGLAHKQEILALIDSDRAPDKKDQMIKTQYPDDYRYLLQNCYPALRHSDYTVEYIVRAYTDVEEAKRVLQTAPGKLSLQEFYMIANSYQPGSTEYNEIFETMVRLYPNDEVANLNAANVAMGKKDLPAARKYLAKAGESREAVYARGVLAGLEGDYETAKSSLEKAVGMGVKDAEESLKKLELSHK